MRDSARAPALSPQIRVSTRPCVSGRGRGIGVTLGGGHMLTLSLEHPELKKEIS